MIQHDVTWNVSIASQYLFTKWDISSNVVCFFVKHIRQWTYLNVTTYVTLKGWSASIDLRQKFKGWRFTRLTLSQSVWHVNLLSPHPFTYLTYTPRFVAFLLKRKIFTINLLFHTSFRNLKIADSIAIADDKSKKCGCAIYLLNESKSVACVIQTNKQWKKFSKRKQIITFN